MSDEDQSTLGCSKCRFSQRGCKRCKDPAFQNRKRGNEPSARPQQPKRQKRQRSTSRAAASKTAVQSSQECLHAASQPADCQSDTVRVARQLPKSKPSAFKSDSTKPELHLEPTKAPPPDSSAVPTTKDSRLEAQGPEAEEDKEPPSSVTARNAQHALMHLSAAEADDAAVACDDPAADLPTTIRNATAQQAKAESDPEDAAAVPLVESHTVTPGTCSQGTASDSRPSFLSMLQSKMEKRRQQRRKSQSAGSASDSSMSSVHAAGPTSAERAQKYVDSGACARACKAHWTAVSRLQLCCDINAQQACNALGTQAPQAMTAPRHKVKQQKRGSAKKPARTRAFLQAGADPRQALWHPPASPYGLIEEVLYEDPWKLLVACMLLNVTSGLQVRKVIWRLFAIWPTAEAAAAATDDTLVIVEKLIQPLGLFRKRTMAIKRFSQEYLNAEWLDPIELHGIGQYASDAYFMFCRGNWQDVEPSDKDLLRYQNWLHSTGGEGTGLERDVMPDVHVEEADKEPSA